MTREARAASRAGKAAKACDIGPSKAICSPKSKEVPKVVEHHDAEAKSDKPGEPSLVDNTDISEGEAEQFWAPEDVVAEEEKLRKEREAQEEEVSQASRPLAPAALETNRFAQLEHLLSKADLYTQFLTEQIQDIDTKITDQSSSQHVQEQEAKGKGKGKGKGRPAKKRKVDQDAPAASGRTPTQELCPQMTVELRDYQLKGVKWMISLYQNGLNGILADQMGLGKTVQTIGFLSHLRSKGVYGPFLVVGPLSTLPNWVNEFKRFCPEFPVVLYHGSRDERAELRAEHLQLRGAPGPTYPVICTSYEIVISDVKFLSSIHFKYIVVDEGHRLKNTNCRLIRELRTIPAANKLLLTGTPLQNNLAELWSLLNFLVPDIFSSLGDFESWFDFSYVGQEDTDKEVAALEQRNKVVSKIHSILKPFLLRRLKSDVEISLPRKMEVLLFAHMSEEQKKINTQLAEKTLLNELLKKAQDEGGSTSSIAKLNNVLMQMRKNCNHPDLITSQFGLELDYPPPGELIRQCGKLALLDRMLRKLHAGGHKVLIFSQMTKMLDLLESFLEQQNHRVCRIDGSIPWQQRQQNIKDFNEDPDAWVFLLSTRAGGLGINLVAADTVIIYDSDWNPQQDLQAMDRAHRIGQRKPVLVFRLATAHSVEGKMLKRAASKMMLERLIIKKGTFKELVDGSKQGGKQDASMNASELLELLRSDVSSEDVAQSGTVSNEMLNQLLDRSHLEGSQPLPFPQLGMGYEVVQATESSTLLKGVE